MTKYCCRLCDIAIADGYFVARDGNVTMYIQRFSEASFFSKSMRDFSFCPFCGKNIEQHSPSIVYDCPPFKTAASLGNFVFRLENYKSKDKMNILSFNLVSHHEYEKVTGSPFTTGSPYYPRPTGIKHCPYCGANIMIENREITANTKP